MGRGGLVGLVPPGPRADHGLHPVEVVLGDQRSWAGCSGEGTAPLAAAAGVDVPAGLLHHARFTFTLRDPGASPACWLDRSEAWRAGFTTYSHAIGEQGRWTIGGSLDESDTRWDLGAATVIERSRTVVTRYVREYLDGVVPEVIDILYCNHTASPASGDSLGAARNSAVFAVWGDNLFKMAPLLGALLAQTARTLTIPPPLAQPIPRSSSSAGERQL